MEHDGFPSLYTPAGAVGAQQSTSDAAGTSAAAGDAPSTAAQALAQLHEQNGDSAQSGSDPSDNAAINGASGGKSGKQARAQLDLASESAFPSLGGPAPGKSAAVSGGGWGAAAASRARATASAPAVAAPQLYTESFVLPSNSISVGGPPAGGYSASNRREEQPTTLGGVLQLLMSKYPSTKIEASTSTAKNTTTFLFKSHRQQDIERVKNDLKARVVRKINDTIQVPASTRAFIIGAKGRTLNAISAETGVQIQIPRDTEGAESAPVSDEPTYGDEEDEEKPDFLISITLHGDAGSIALAKQRIKEIVKERTSRTTVKVNTVPLELYHLLSGKVAKQEIVQEGDDAVVNIPPIWKSRAGPGRGASASSEDANGAEPEPPIQKDNAITITGDREAVQKTVETLNAVAEELGRTSQTISMSLQKRQHRFIQPTVLDQILQATSCSVEVPPSSNPSDQITIRGPSDQLIKALQAVMEKANTAAVDTVELTTAHGKSTPATYPKQVARYLLAKQKLRKIAEEQNVQIFVPRPSDNFTTIDIVATSPTTASPAAAVAAARSQVSQVVKSLPPSGFGTVEIDQLLHRFLIGRKGARITSFEEKSKVQVVFPSQNATYPAGEEKIILLVYVGEDSSKASDTLKDVKSEIEKMAKEAADITSQTLSIPAKLHRHIIGPGGTTLNALIGTGDERVVSVKFGSSASSGKPAANGDATPSSAAENEVVIRGPGDEVKKIASEIERIAEEAKNDEIQNSYVSEFDIEQRFVSHVVGKGGSSVAKLREDLGVRIDFSDAASATAAPAAGENKVTKKSSTTKKDTAKAHVRIQGRKENVEEAKRRVQRQVEALADETTLSLALSSAVERGSLIGKQGTYVQRLETKYAVRINIPRSEEDGNAISIRGGKKGAEAARKELVDLIEYEKENNQSTSFSVPGRALPRIFGRQGASIKEIQDESGAQIDVTKNDPSNPEASGNVTIKGTKNAIAQAKKMINAIVAEIQDESVHEVTIERQYHQNIIGKGGQNIRELITRCGGPSDAKTAGQMVRFPKTAEDDSTVTVRAPSEIASKIKAELEKQVAALKDRVALGVAVPQSGHARLIGRGGAGVNELQRKHNVKIFLPGRAETRGSEDLENKDELADVAETDLIKVVGPKDGAEAAVEEIKTRAAASAAQGQGAAAGQRQRQGQKEQADQVVKTVDVPTHLHSRVAQGGKFFRSLPNGVRIDHGDVKPPSHNAARPKANGSSTSAGRAARIDEDDAADDSDFGWEVTALNESSEDVDATIPWNVRGSDAAKVDRVEAMINAALERTRSETHQGVLTVPQSLIPRVVGRQGSNLDKLRAIGVSAEVEGRQGANSVVFIGTPEKIEEARQAVLELSQNTRGGR